MKTDPTPTIPLNDLARQHVALRGELDAAIAEVVSTSAFIGGQAVKRFARDFAAFCGVEHAIPCSNGTEALRIALLAVLGEGKGTCEIVTVAHTFAATAEAIVQAGYRPVFVDVDPATGLMDFARVENACNESTIAILPVHLYGQMVETKALRDIADRRGLAIIEDAAQAHGADFDQIGPGQLGKAAAFSFFPGKNLGAWGDAGAIVTNDHDVARCAARLVDHGRTDKFTHARVGTNARMDTIQAAILNVKLPHLRDWNQARGQAARKYDSLLADATFSECVRPTVAPGARHVFHQYVVQVPEREAVRAFLHDAGIGTGVHYPVPLHQQPAFARHSALAAAPHSGSWSITPDPLPVTHELCQRILSLPMFPGITEHEVERVVHALGEAVAATTAVTV
jgi:dTDP-4-amino-4,6-dideoxygalactose transaminase